MSMRSACSPIELRCKMVRAILAGRNCCSQGLRKAKEGFRVVGYSEPIVGSSHAAYGRTPDGEKYPVGCPDEDFVLQRLEWSRWEDFPDAGPRDKIAKFHLRVEAHSSLDSNSRLTSTDADRRICPKTRKSDSWPNGPHESD